MLNTIQNDLRSELEQVESIIIDSTQSQVELITQIKELCIKQPGKKLVRPTLVILSAKACQCFSEQTLLLAAIIELIHSATLLHDDVLDRASVRRSQPTTFASFGSTQAILMGDFLYACAFQLIAQLQSNEITQILAHATKVIVEGEVSQLSLQNNHLTSLESYFNIISAKTAQLFSVGTHCATLAKPQLTQAAGQFGHHFGMLYQITDDILDVNTQNTNLNKHHGNDLREQDDSAKHTSIRACFTRRKSHYSANHSTTKRLEGYSAHIG